MSLYAFIAPSASYLYFRTTPATTPPTLSSFLGLIGLYFGSAGVSETLSPRFFRYFIVHCPSTSAITISPDLGVRLLSTTTMSPGRMPASDMESPDTLRRKVACGFWIRNWSRDMVSASSSSAGIGKPASTVPSTLSGEAIDFGISFPFLSLSSTSICSSLLTNLETLLFDRKPTRSPISEKLGMRSRLL